VSSPPARCAPRGVEKTIYRITGQHGKHIVEIDRTRPRVRRIPIPLMPIQRYKLVVVLPRHTRLVTRLSSAGALES